MRESFHETEVPMMKSCSLENARVKTEKVVVEVERIKSGGSWVLFERNKTERKTKKKKTARDAAV